MLEHYFADFPGFFFSVEYAGIDLTRLQDSRYQTPASGARCKTRQTCGGQMDAGAPQIRRAAVAIDLYRSSGVL